MQRFYPELLWLATAVGAALVGWLLVREAAIPNGRAAVEHALRQARPADLESLTVYPLVPTPGGATARAFQVRDPRQLRSLLPALRQLRRVADTSGAFQPLLEATVVVRLGAAPAAAWHLHSRVITFRLASAPGGEVAQLAQTNYFYHAAALGLRLRQLRDSLARP